MDAIENGGANDNDSHLGARGKIGAPQSIVPQFVVAVNSPTKNKFLEKPWQGPKLCGTILAPGL